VTLPGAYVPASIAVQVIGHANLLHNEAVVLTEDNKWTLLKNFIYEDLLRIGTSGGLL
jgi:hypothetical protein